MSRHDKTPIGLRDILLKNGWHTIPFGPASWIPSIVYYRLVARGWRGSPAPRNKSDF